MWWFHFSKDNEGDTPLHDAISRRRDDLVAMLMEGVGGGVITGNIPSSVMATAAAVSGSEHTYDRVCSITSDSEKAMASTDITTSTLSITREDNEASITNEIEDAAACSSSVACSSSAGTSAVMASGSGTSTTECATTNYTTAISDPVYPIIGSPPADLMVVNTNGFNPLQHAALRGNPGWVNNSLYIWIVENILVLLS